VGLIARGIEEGGIPTVYIGSCRDMMALVKAPRSVFVDFPLGHQCGKPHDVDSQMAILKDALQILVRAEKPGEIFDLPYRWGKAFGWEDYEKDLVEMFKEEGQPDQAWIPKK
jgi:hypothetical protein